MCNLGGGEGAARPGAENCRRLILILSVLNREPITVKTGALSRQDILSLIVKMREISDPCRKSQTFVLGSRGRKGPFRPFLKILTHLNRESRVNK